MHFFTFVFFKQKSRYLFIFNNLSINSNNDNLRDNNYIANIKIYIKRNKFLSLNKHNQNNGYLFLSPLHSKYKICYYNYY